jgi:hypothetical protein
MYIKFYSKKVAFMLAEIEVGHRDVELNKWHRVRAINNESQENVYVHFKQAWDLTGNSLARLPKESTVICDLEYSGNQYP